MNDKPKDQKLHWLVRPATIRLLWGIGIAILALTVWAETFIEPHPYFKIDGIFGFNAWYGLGACIAMILFAKFLGVFLKRKDTYYNDK
ncbi:MAG: hypothetical protein OEZ19_09140 [Paracoccaceae bacterium]|nr:hypothetical protein [Paracoccaceae bacterium]